MFLFLITFALLLRRSCGGGISRQQRRCRRKPCKGRSWNTKYKICNPEVSHRTSIHVTFPEWWRFSFRNLCIFQHPLLCNLFFFLFFFKYLTNALLRRMRSNVIKHPNDARKRDCIIYTRSFDDLSTTTQFTWLG